MSLPYVYFATDGAGGGDLSNVLATDIWFHFQGGYTNAVRRSVRVKEFF